MIMNISVLGEARFPSPQPFFVSDKARVLFNVIVDPDEPQAGRADTLYDSLGNDLIQSGGGSDYIDAKRGGDDRIEAGEGDDWVSAGAGDDRNLLVEQTHSSFSSQS